MFRRSLRTSALVTLMLAASCATKTAAMTCTGTEPILRQKGVLQVAADLTYPPFAYDRQHKPPAGFEADLLRAIATDMHMEVLLYNRGTSSLVTGLLGHRNDLAAAGLIDTKDLRGEVCTSAPYLNADLGVVVPSPDPHGIKAAGDLDGRPVGVRRGGRGERWAREHLQAASIRPMPADSDLVDALRNREVDGVITDLPLARYEATQASDVTVADVIATGEHYVMAVAPDNGGLVAKINAELAKLDSSGRLDQIRAKWFGA